MAGLQTQLRTFGRLVLDTVLPPTDDSEIFAALTFLDEPCCACCGYPFEHQLAGLGGAQELHCASCLAYPPAYHSARAALRYDDASRPLVLAFKHGGRTDRLASFAAQMQRAGRVALGAADQLVPVPLHRSRLIRRRYNQSALLARALSRRTGTPVAQPIIRTRRTRSQGELSAVGRRRNVGGAFAVPDPEAVSGRHLVLIDDVMTTGATLNACARTLKRAGAARVDALCLARVVRPLPAK